MATTNTGRAGSSASSSATPRATGSSISVAQKIPCIAASTSNLTLSGEQTINSIACVDGDRVLATGQTNGAENGPWVVSTGAWQRPADWNANGDVVEGTAVRVTRGSNRGNWLVTTTGTITIDTTSVTLSLETALVSGSLAIANNLSDVASIPTSLINLFGTTASIASAATTVLTAATGISVLITGTTGISAFTMTDQQICLLRFSGALTITVGASLVGNNNGGNIEIEAGDQAIVRRSGSIVYFTHLPVRNRAWSKWTTTVASSGTIALLAGTYGHVTGTTGITDVDWTVAGDGQWAFVEFDGALTITHSSTLKCPGSTNLPVTAGSVVLFIQDSGDTVRVVPLFTTSTTVTGTIDEWLPAGAFIPQITNGPSAGIVELSTTKMPLTTLDFDTTTAETAHCFWRPPKRWDGGNITFEALWTAASGSGGVAFGLAGRAFSDDDALDTAYGTQVVVTDTFIVANDLHISATSASVTFAGSPQDADMIALSVQRVVSNGSDTLAVDAKLIGVVIHWTANAGTDS